MPITFLIDDSTQTVHTTVTGPLVGTDLVDYLSEVLEHPAYRPGLSALVVCKDVAFGSISTSAVRRLVSFSKKTETQLLGSRVAIVADQPVLYGFSRMYELLRDPPYELRVFRGRGEAEAWLAATP